ncbi:phosphatase PAP2 family protein [Sporolactobacillus sp. THM7-4]|nr:phosphatase PAP2 family protein [Sporolactobacillus sp. THM7-4]
MGLKDNLKMMINWLWVLLICTGLFLLLMLAVRNPAFVAIDKGLLNRLDPIRVSPFVTFFAKLTDFGASGLLIPIIAFSMLFLAYKRQITALILLQIAFLTERGLNGLLKHWIMRDRPAAPHLVHEYGYSFPSGHAMNAAVVYGLLILLITPVIRIKRMKIIWTSICLAMILLIGFSRPFLRVHYFSDVLAGYCAGGAIISVCAIILLFVQQIRQKKGCE